MLSIGEFAKRIGVSTQTLRGWDKTGKLKPDHISAGGQRVYTEEQALQYLGENYNIDDLKDKPFISLTKEEMERVITCFSQMLHYLEDVYNSQ